MLCKLKLWPAPLTAPLTEIVPLPELKALAPLTVTAAKLMPLFVVLMVPLSVVVFAILVTPLVKFKVPPLPKVTPFLLLKVVAVVIVPVPVPNKFTA